MTILVEGPPRGGAQTVADGIEAQFREVTRSKARLISDIAYFDVSGYAREMGASSTATWLIRRLEIASSTAHEYVKVARAMLEFHQVARVFFSGEVNYSKVRLLTSFLEPENEAELVELARTLGYHELERALCRFKNKDEDDVEAESFVRLRQRNDGRVDVWASLSPDDGARLMAALKVGELAWHLEDFEDVLGSDGAVDEAKLDAALDALDAQDRAEEERIGAGAKVTSCSGFGLPLGKAMVASLMGMVNMVLAKPRNALRTPGAHVNVVMDASGRAYLPANPGAPSEAVKNFLANATFRVNTVDENGLVINTGRAQRLATDAQVNALMLMWRGQCAMPGCTHTRFMDMHHIRDWATGGPTDLDNLLPLCSACHRLVSEGFVEIRKEYGDVHFIFRDGTRYVARNHGVPVRQDDAMTMDEFAVEWG